MSEQIDWSKAPEGYPLWITDPDGITMPDWHKEIEGKYVDMHGGFWDKSDGGFTVHKRPSTPSWSGEGLPPVGVVCEVGYCEQWHPCEIIAHFQQRCGMVAAFTVDIVNGAKSLDAFGEGSFRPIRTPEQIAADEREAQIVAIHDAIVTSVKVTLGQCDSCRKVAEMVYDAGFKRE